MYGILFPKRRFSEAPFRVTQKRQKEYRELPSVFCAVMLFQIEYTSKNIITYILGLFNTPQQMRHDYFHNQKGYHCI